MPVASSTPLPRGRGRGRGRWAGDPFPSPGSRTGNASVTPPSTSGGKAKGEKTPSESPSPRDNSVVTLSLSSPKDRTTNGEKAQSLSMGTIDTPATSVCVQKVQSPNSRMGQTGETPPPAYTWIQKSQSSNQLSKHSREIPSPPDAWLHKSQSQNSLPADSIRITAPSDPTARRNVAKNTRSRESRELYIPAKLLFQTQEIPRSRNDSAEETFARDKAKRLRLKENGRIVSPADTPTKKTSPRTSQSRYYNGQTQTPPFDSSTGVQHAPTTPIPTPLSGGEVPPGPSTNVWVQRARAREEAQSPSSGGGIPPRSPGGGGKSPRPLLLPGQEPASPDCRPRARSISPAPASPRGRGGEEELPASPHPPPPSPRGKDCSANSDSSADDAELEGLVGLPDHVLMYNKRDPVSVLMEYGQTREVKVKFTEMSRSGPHHASRFHTAAIVDDETHLHATGTSKKNAKKVAAILALRTMYERGMANLQEANATVNRELKEMEAQQHPPDDDHPDQPHQQGKSGWPCLGTRVMHVSRRLLEVAEETQFINYSKDKVLAAIVLERRGSYTVVGLGTGNRCIQHQNLPTDGSRVIHSHAEIIARRAFIRYMLRELAAYRGTEREKHALFTRSRHTGLLKLHEDIRVHLYISRPPCGDAAAFPTITNFPNRMRAIRKQGQLRTIIDDGEGAIPTEFPLPANANGKERLRVMTCSDKILRWNAVGIQGALLSNFMDPVYLSSVVIGSHTGDQQGHVPRAISGRLKCGRLHEALMKPFRISSPEIVYPPHSDNYAITKSKQYCITWSEGDPDAEVLDAVLGSVAMEPADDSPSSRVSKRTLLALFRHTSHNLKADHLATLTYAEAKAAARAYQRTKKSVETHLQSCGFGQWLSLQLSYGVDNFQEAEKQ